jgi:GxxExxY protein
MIEGTENRKGSVKRINALTKAVIGAAICEKALGKDGEPRGLPFRRQVPIPVDDKGELLDSNFRLDMVMDDCVIVEIKAVDSVLPVHEAQHLSQLKLSGIRVGLLTHFHAMPLKQGIHRIMNGHLDP